MFRCITPGVIVSEYPIPISDRYILFLPAISLSIASASVSVTGGLKCIPPLIRIDSGITELMNSSRDVHPRAFSISLTSSDDGPMWREENFSERRESILIRALSEEDTQLICPNRKSERRQKNTELF